MMVVVEVVVFPVGFEVLSLSLLVLLVWASLWVVWFGVDSLAVIRDLPMFQSFLWQKSGLGFPWNWLLILGFWRC